MMTHSQISSYEPTAVEASVARLFRELEQRKVRYAVLRNYELLPSLRREDGSAQRTDIDLVVDSRDLPSWREVAKDVAEQNGWDALTECDHWMQSPAQHHNAEVFRFNRFSPPEFLHVDVFHGYLISGLPLVDEAGMLAGRIKDPGGRFTRIDPVTENLYRLMQVYSHYCENPASAKVTRYRKRLLQFWETDRERFRRRLRSKFFLFGEQAVEALQQEDMNRFARKMRWARLYFTVKFSLAHPVRTPWYWFCRKRENRVRFFTRPCGRVVPTCAAEEKRQTLRDVLDELSYKNFMDRWAERTAPAQDISKIERSVMEQGGLVIEWSSPEASELVITAADDRESIARKVIEILLVRHPCLFRRAEKKGIAG